MWLTIEPIPRWVDARRLLGVEPTERQLLASGKERLRLAVPAAEAARVLARTRGLGIDGSPLSVRAQPELSRQRVRAGRLLDARDRRVTTPGFTRPGALASGAGRYSLTPEALALSIAERAPAGDVVDACCGSGGNAIAFARAGRRVIAIDSSPERLSEARHNARVYGVTERVTFVSGDALALVPTLEAQLLFVDPPWGERYDKTRSGLSDFPLLEQLLPRVDATRFAHVCAKVPASFETSALPAGETVAWFGRASGDLHRIKFVTVTWATSGST